MRLRWSPIVVRTSISQNWPCIIGWAIAHFISPLDVPINFLWVHGALHVRDPPLSPSHNRPQSLFPLLEQWVINHSHYFKLWMSQSINCASHNFRSICFDIAHVIYRSTGILIRLGAMRLLPTGRRLSIWLLLESFLLVDYPILLPGLRQFYLVLILLIDKLLLGASDLLGLR